MQWVSRAPSLTRVAPFDGMRAVGVMAVMIGHALPGSAESFSGFIDLFFVLSGFLITTLLLEEHRSTGDIRLRSFYARRTLRLLPSLWVTLGVTVGVAILLTVLGRLGPRYSLTNLWIEISAGATYVTNLTFPFFRAWTGHLWTLAVEEQFYLVAGFLLVWALRRGYVRALVIVLVPLVAAVWIWRISGVVGPAPYATFLVWTQRPDALAVGMLTALLSAQLPTQLSPRATRIIGAAGIAGGIALIYICFAATGLMKTVFPAGYIPVLTEDDFLEGGSFRGYWFNWGFNISIAASACLALAAFRVRDWKLAKPLSWRPIAFVGAALSYPLYLLHYPVLIVLESLVGPREPHAWFVVPTWLFVALAVTIPFALAYPCYRFVELRALRLRGRFGWSSSGSAHAPTSAAPTATTAEPEPEAVAAPPPRRPYDRRPVRPFLTILAFGTATAWLGALAGAPHELVVAVNTLGLTCAAVAAVTVFGTGDDRRRARQRWTIKGLTVSGFALMLSPLFFHFIGVDITTLLGRGSELELAVSTAPALIAAVVTAFVFAGVEEFAFRGVLLARLGDRSPVRAATLVSLVWIAWLSPLAVTQLGPVLFAALAVALFAASVVYTALWNRSSGSLVAVFVMHVIVELVALVKGGVVEFAVPLGFVTLAAVLLIKTKGRLFFSPSSSSPDRDSPPQPGIDGHSEAPSDTGADVVDLREPPATEHSPDDRTPTGRRERLLSGRVDSFDALRALMVLGIVVHHAFFRTTASMVVIVDLFFVMSGFLISTLLLGEHRATGTIRLRGFYLRRTTRLYPALIVLLGVTVVVAAALWATGHLGPQFILSDLPKQVLAGATYTHNLVYPLMGAPFTPHLWTLALEEQFYLVAGAVMLVALSRRRDRLLLTVLVVSIVAIQLWRLSGVIGPVPYATALAWFQRPDALMLGVVLGLTNARIGNLAPATTKWLRIMGAVGGVAFLYAMLAASEPMRRYLPWLHAEFLPDEIVVGEPLRGYWSNWGYTLAIWGGALLLFAVYRIPDFGINRLLARPRLARFGKRYSYPLYLMHYPVVMVVFLVLTDFGPNPLLRLPTWAAALLTVVLSVAVTAPVVHYVERPVARLRARFGWTSRASRADAQARDVAAAPITTGL